ncbi:MAG: Tad domain-containing protein [Acidimicrobiia bacterium]
MLDARANSRNESGAVAILVAISMVVLLGIAAIAIDLGAGFNERRQDQTSADLAAVAGALSFGSKSAMVSQVLTVARANLDTSYTDAEWQAAWQSCTDPGRTAAFLPMPEPSGWGSGTLDCISLSPSSLRVRVPEQETDTTFGQLIGVDALSTDAYAVVTVFPPEGEGALPFALVAGAGPGEICLDTGTPGSDPPCNGPAEGSFGNIAPPLFGNDGIPTQPECDQQTSANNHVPESIAMGVDHIIWTYPSTSWDDTLWSRADNTAKNTVFNSTVHMDLCNEVTSDGVTVAAPADGVLIDGVVIDTGNSVKADVTEGLISATNFSDDKPGRLWRTTNPIDVKSGNDPPFELDNQPLWAHLLSNGGSVSYLDLMGYAPASCDPINFTVPTTNLLTLDANNAQMQECLEDYAGAAYSGQIFADSIRYSPRFGVAPQLWHYNLGSGVNYRPVERFRQVYLAGVWFDLKSVGPNEVFYPGYPGDEWCPVMEGSKCAEIVEIEQLTAFLLDSAMVSTAVAAIYPGADQSGLLPTITE